MKHLSPSLLLTIKKKEKKRVRSLIHTVLDDVIWENKFFTLKDSLLFHAFIKRSNARGFIKFGCVQETITFYIELNIKSSN